MRVAIAVDARAVYRPRRRGTGKNLLDVYRALARLRRDWHFILYHQTPRIESDPFASFDNVQPKYIDIPGDRWRGWQHLRLPLAAWRDRAQLLHCPANSCCCASRIPMISTIHDLIPLKVDDPLTHAQRSRFLRDIQRCLKKSRRIIAVSNSTKQDLISDHDADPRLIDVLYWAPDSQCRVVQDEAELERVRARYNIHGPYVLSFSGQTRRKNADGMIRAFGRLSPQIRRETQYVIVGVEPEQRRSELRGLTESLGIQDRCGIYGFAPETDVAALLSGARMLAFCSLYEGFGLPILDAFQCQTAVLTSQSSSMPEVAGEAAMYCDPLDPASIADGMSRILQDPNLREQLIIRGRARLEKFTWQRSAETLAEVFEKCL